MNVRCETHLLSPLPTQQAAVLRLVFAVRLRNLFVRHHRGSVHDLPGPGRTAENASRAGTYNVEALRLYDTAVLLRVPIDALQRLQNFTLLLTENVSHLRGGYVLVIIISDY